MQSKDHDQQGSSYANVGWYDREIREQPESLARLLDRGWSAIEEASKRIRAFDPRFVVVAARGTSDNAARYAQYLLGIRNGWSVALAAPSIVTRYDAPLRLSGALVVGISQSGQSPDVVEMIRRARTAGALTLAVVNDGSSKLAEAAELCIPVLAGEERAVAATKTYVGELCAIAMLSTELATDPSRRRELDVLPDRISTCLEAQAELAERAQAYMRADRFVILGRGYNLSTAFETALKIKETSYVIAEPYSGADFLHGPIAMLDRRLPVLAYSLCDRWTEETLHLIGRAQKQNAPVIAVSDQEAVLQEADLPIRLPPETPEWVSPMVAIVPGQLWAGALAAKRRAAPDAPRGLSKVTETW